MDKYHLTMQVGLKVSTRMPITQRMSEPDISISSHMMTFDIRKPDQLSDKMQFNHTDTHRTFTCILPAGAEAGCSLTYQ